MGEKLADQRPRQTHQRGRLIHLRARCAAQPAQACMADTETRILQNVLGGQAHLLDLVLREALDERCHGHRLPSDGPVL